jgi:hypothetical protein
MITTTRASLQLPLPEASHSWCKSTSWHAHGKAGHSTRFQLNSCSGSPKKKLCQDGTRDGTHDGTVANKLFARNTWHRTLSRAARRLFVLFAGSSLMLFSDRNQANRFLISWRSRV